MIARRVFEDCPPDFEGIREQDAARVHMIVVGTKALGRALALKGLQLCHYANHSRLRLTIA